MTAPQHSATAPIRFVSLNDDAWDLATANAEVEALEDDKKGDHPVTRYIQGKTRFDLDAPGQVGDETKTPRDYLKAGVEPTIWTLRRLKISELTRCRDMGGRAGQLEAFRLALTDVAPQRCKIPEDTVRVQDKALQTIVDAYGAETVWSVGEAALLAAAAPTDAEKKP